ncbi:major facilitator superfamily domain-containing protein [Penicillium sp. IBT 18751x]|nr:major facilitator superfamily domain-containing protein [Penicillium sp. IBT 18751x]
MSVNPAVLLSLGLALFLTGIEATIVSTSLVTIVDDLQNFEQSSWIVTSYLLTYTGFMVIWSNLGNVFGVKQALLSSLFVFTAFSGGCGGAQTFNQLVISRAFQGIGGAGVYTLACFSFIRIVPPEQYKLTTTIAGGVISLGLVLGPLFGGAISNSGKWRWVFLYK